MSIKIKGLEALSTLCGGQPGREITTSQEGSQPSGGAVLDKYTIQEKVVPLLKAIKTKEPAVMVSVAIIFSLSTLTANRWLLWTFSAMLVELATLTSWPWKLFPAFGNSVLARF